MKTKTVLLGLLMLVIAAGAWAGRVAWRVHRQLVTLNVRNAPLPEVIRAIEKQTWKKIRAEKSLENVRVSLRVVNKPLSTVLDRLAAQAGARWTTQYAVYDSGSALKALDSTLRGDGKLEPAGWMKVAPNPEGMNHLGMGGGGGVEHFEPGGRPMTLPFPAEGTAPSEPGTSYGGGGTFSPQPGQRRVVMVRRGPGGPITFQGGGPDGKVEVWSPEEVLMQGSLLSRLASDPSATNSPPTPKTAAQIARKANAKWTTYLAFSKSSFGLGMGGMPPGRERIAATASGSKNGGPPGLNLRGPNINARFDTLTPNQRVQRARERAQFRISEK